MEGLETHEEIHKAAEHGSAHNLINRRIGVLIAGLAALLAISEAAGKAAQTTAVDANIRASDQWAFFQAKTIRQTTIRTAAENAALAQVSGNVPPDAKAAVQKQIDAWNATVARYESEPATGDGRKELMEKAKAAEAERDHALSAYHMFEYGSAAFQIAIVLASSAVITALMFLAFGAAALGAVGAACSLVGWFAPTLLH